MNPEDKAQQKTIQKGTIIHGPYWPEPVEVKLIEEAGEYVHIVGDCKSPANLHSVFDETGLIC